MKKLLTLLAFCAGLAVMVPTASVASDHGHGHSSRAFAYNCGSCGTPVYRERAVTAYDRHGHPVYGWRTVGHSCRGNYGPGHGGSSSHNQGGGHSGGHISVPGFHLDFGSRHGRH